MPIVVTTGGVDADDDVCSPWITRDQLSEPILSAEYDPALLDDCLLAASGVLYHLSGRQYPGVCESTVRPGTRPARERGRPIMGGYLGPWAYSYQSGGWSSGYWPGGWCSCNAADRPGEQGLPEVFLGGRIRTIEEVKIDGVVLDPSEYRIDNTGTSLIRTADANGQGRSWPYCHQRLDLPDTEVGTWSVRLTHGRLPGKAGQMSSAALAVQLVLAFTPKLLGQCRLPKRMVNITRQGVTGVALDALPFIREGRTGLPEVDMWLHGVNPHALTRRATIASPDLGPRVRRAGS